MSENSLPPGWKQVKVRDILEVHYGKGLTKAKRNETGSIPVYGSNGQVGQHDTALVEGPSIIIGRKGAAGAVHITKLLAGQSIQLTTLNPQMGCLLNTFIMY